MSQKKFRRALLGMSRKSPKVKTLRKEFIIPIDLHIDADARGDKINGAIETQAKEKIGELIDEGKAGFARYTAIHFNFEDVNFRMMAGNTVLHVVGTCYVTCWYQIGKGA